MLDVFGLLKARLLEQSGRFRDEDFLIRGMWKVELAFRPNPAERTFRYTFWLAMTRAQGCCYCTGDDERGRELVGSDARGLIQEKTCISIAALDSLYGSIPRQPTAVHELRGDPIEKTRARTAILVEESMRLLEGQKKRAKVVNVGVVGNVISTLASRGFEVHATDLESDMVGSEVHGVRVEPGSKTIELVRDSDLAIVTGMTIATDSLGPIVEAARESDTRLLVFAETGANFGQEYCCTFGIDTAVAEPFPFYIFQGLSRIEVFRRQ